MRFAGGCQSQVTGFGAVRPAKVAILDSCGGMAAPGETAVCASGTAGRVVGRTSDGRLGGWLAMGGELDSSARAPGVEDATVGCLALAGVLSLQPAAASPTPSISAVN